MSASSDPTDSIRQAAADFPEVAKGTACTQSSFKAGKGTFLFIGPGPKGVGYKAMFKLKESMDQARALAEEQPSRYEVGNTGWVTTRFSADDPLPASIWKPWLDESYGLTIGSKK